MLTVEKVRLSTMLKAQDYRRLKDRLQTAKKEDLAREWSALPPWEQLIVFKLMDAPTALDFYGERSLKEKYLLFSGFPLNSIAPVLEDASPEVRRLFVPLPAGFYKTMLAELK